MNSPQKTKFNSDKLLPRSFFDFTSTDIKLFPNKKEQLKKKKFNNKNKSN